MAGAKHDLQPHIELYKMSAQQILDTTLGMAVDIMAARVRLSGQPTHIAFETKSKEKALDHLKGIYQGDGWCRDDQSILNSLSFLRTSGVKLNQKISDLWAEGAANGGVVNTYSQNGLDYIKSWEKCSLTSYDAVPGTRDWTIGWGHKLHQYSGLT